MKYFYLLLLCLSVSSCGPFIPGCSLPARQSESLSEEQFSPEPATDFSLPALDGGTVELSDLRGRVVLLDFWTTWCPPCQVSTPALNQLYGKLKGEKVQFLAISLDEDIASVKEYVKEKKIPFPTLIGTGSSVDEDYQVRAIPTFVIVDPQGQSVARFSGFYPGMEKEIESKIRSLLK